MEADLEAELEEIFAQGAPSSPLRLFNEVCKEQENSKNYSEQATHESYYGCIPPNKTIQDIPLSQISDAFLSNGLKSTFFPKEENKPAFSNAFAKPFLPCIIANTTTLNASVFPTMETLLKNQQKTNETYAALLNVPKTTTIWPNTSDKDEKIVTEEQMKRDRLMKGNRKKETRRNKFLSAGRWYIL